MHGYKKSRKERGRVSGGTTTILFLAKNCWTFFKISLFSFFLNRQTHLQTLGENAAKIYTKHAAQCHVADCFRIS